MGTDSQAQEVNMNDAELWERERKGEPVTHCRAKIKADERARKIAENRAGFARMRSRDFV